MGVSTYKSWHKSSYSFKFKYRQNAPFSVLVFKKILCRSTSFQTSSQCTIYHLCFHFFLQFQFVSNIRMHVLEILFSKDSCGLPIFSNTVRVHALETLFKKKKCLQFQIVSNSVRMHSLYIEKLFSFFLCSSEPFQISSEYML